MFTFRLYPGEYTPRVLAFIFGGGTATAPQLNSTETVTNTIRRYDGSTLSTDSATLQYNTKGAGAGSIGSDCYQFGGMISFNTSFGNNPTNIIAKYNGTTRSNMGATISKGAGISCTTLGSTLWTFGGSDNLADATNGPTRNINSWDGTTLTQVGLLESLSGQAKNIFATASSQVNSSLAAIWGGSGTTGAILSRLQTWDGSTCVCVTVGLANAMAYAACGTISGKSYRVGGNSAGTTIASYDGTTIATDAVAMSAAKTAPGCSITNGVIKLFGGTTSAITSFNGTTYSTDASTISNANTAAVTGALG